MYTTAIIILVIIIIIAVWRWNSVSLRPVEGRWFALDGREVIIGQDSSAMFGEEKKLQFFPDGTYSVSSAGVVKTYQYTVVNLSGGRRMMLVRTPPGEFEPFMHNIPGKGISAIPSKWKTATEIAEITPGQFALVDYTSKRVFVSGGEGVFYRHGLIIQTLIEGDNMHVWVFRVEDGEMIYHKLFNRMG